MISHRIVDNMPITWCYTSLNQQHCMTGFPLGCFTLLKNNHGICGAIIKPVRLVVYLGLFSTFNTATTHNYICVCKCVVQAKYNPIQP